MKKILIVDDDDACRESLSDLLKASGYHTAGASSCKEALEKITVDNYDIALVDLIMPKVSGIDTLKEMKKLRPKLQIIMITAFPELSSAVEAMKKGATDYIAKPFKRADILTAINKGLEEALFKEQMHRLSVDDTLSSISNPIRRNIIELLNSRTGVRLVEITKELRIKDHSKAIFHLKVLEEKGIVKTLKRDNDKLYFLTNKGESAVDYLKILGNHHSE